MKTALEKNDNITKICKRMQSIVYFANNFCYAELEARNHFEGALRSWKFNDSNWQYLIISISLFYVLSRLNHAERQLVSYMNLVVARL